MTNDFLRVLDLVGVFVMGVAAGAIASRLNFDAVGFAVIGIVAGLGGGLVRDLILDYGTPAAFDGPWYLACALGGAMFTFVIHADGPWWRRLVTVVGVVLVALWAAWWIKSVRQDRLAYGPATWTPVEPRLAADFRVHNDHTARLVAGGRDPHLGPR